jgi:hypothetical protein
VLIPVSRRAIAANVRIQEAGQTGGRGGIRTHGEFNPTLDFESSALNRTQPPFLLLFPTAFEFAREWKPAQAAIAWRDLKHLASKITRLNIPWSEPDHKRPD